MIKKKEEKPFILMSIKILKEALGLPPELKEADFPILISIPIPEKKSVVQCLTVFSML